MNNKIPLFKNPRFKNIFIPWSITFFMLLNYYAFIQFPMERSFIAGLNLLNQNKPIEASAEFSKVLKFYPKYEPVYLNIANYCFKNGQVNEGQERYNYAGQLCLINSEIFSARGLIYVKYRNNLDEGMTFYNNNVLKNYLSNFLNTDAKK